MRIPLHRNEERGSADGHAGRPCGGWARPRGAWRAAVSPPGGPYLPRESRVARPSSSAPINPGNSGGALADLDGRVVGIPTLAAVNPEAGGAPAPGIGFAIPSNTVRRIADQLIMRGHVTNSGRAYLGVRVASSLGATGALVAAVEKGAPAARAGLRAGDRIIAVDGKPTPSPEDLATRLAELRPGQPVPVVVLDPSGHRRSVTVRLGELPS